MHQKCLWSQEKFKLVTEITKSNCEWINVMWPQPMTGKMQKQHLRHQDHDDWQVPKLSAGFCTPSHHRRLIHIPSKHQQIIQIHLGHQHHPNTTNPPLCRSSATLTLKWILPKALDPSRSLKQFPQKGIELRSATNCNECKTRAQLTYLN